MQKWQYKVLRLQTRDVEERLAEIGGHGWELVTATNEATGSKQAPITLYDMCARDSANWVLYCVFKRPSSEN